MCFNSLLFGLLHISLFVVLSAHPRWVWTAVLESPEPVNSLATGLPSTFCEAVELEHGMNKKNKNSRTSIKIVSLLATAIALASTGAQAEFLKDSKATLTFRNFYINRNFVGDNANRSKAEEWTQNFILDFKSGYTEGAVGFGLDILALQSYKLDGGKGTGGTQLLPLDSNGRPAKEFGRLGVAGKMKFSNTELKVGEWAMIYPVLRSDDGRSLPQTFRGTVLTTKEISGVTGYFGHVTGNSPRDDGSMEKMALFGTNPRTSSADSDDFDFAGVEYNFNNKLTTFGAWYARLDDVYKQRYFQIQHKQILSEGMSLNANIGYFDGEDDGKALSGKLDNKVLSGLFWLTSGNHKFYLGLQRVSGDTKWLRVNGTSGGTLANDGYNSSHDNARERSWQLRYDYDFAGLNIPGLTFMMRYLQGHNIHINGKTDGEEWNRESELAYVIQSGTLKNMAFRWRNTTIHRNFGTNNQFDEQRLIVSYSLSLF
ncbi:outer membrane OprD family porin [Azomonas agilis]|uniref:Outer membrane OprD family porin n=2 Tax=Azomonas agilis TaxID=116849 RepID=A0A562IZ66_9GAMM|nr:outer membrane OprD family porin [Azomonas agilis]